MTLNNALTIDPFKGIRSFNDWAKPITELVGEIKVSPDGAKTVAKLAVAELESSKKLAQIKAALIATAIGLPLLAAAIALRIIFPHSALAVYGSLATEITVGAAGLGLAPTIGCIYNKLEQKLIDQINDCIRKKSQPTIQTKKFDIDLAALKKEIRH